MSGKLLNLILFAESEADRLDASLASIASPEARKYAELRAKAARDIAKVLDLVLLYEDAFLDLIEKKSGKKPGTAIRRTT